MALPPELFAGHQSSLSYDLLLVGIAGCRCYMEYPVAIQKYDNALDSVLPAT